MWDQTSAQTSVAWGAGDSGTSGANSASGAPQAVPPAERAAEQAPLGVEHLLFTCRAVPCAVPLGELRAVVRAVPATVALPFSPPWLLGVFAHRTELLGLVDPAPLLLGASAPARDPSAPPPAATLIAGHDEQQIGLAVEALGEIVVIRPDELATTPVAPTHAPFVAPPYLRGRYQPAARSDTAPDAGAPAGMPAVTYAVVDLDPFVAALLDALREGADHA